MSENGDSDPRLKRRLFVMRVAGYTSAAVAAVATAVATSTPALAVDADPNDPPDNDVRDGRRRQPTRRPQQQQRRRVSDPSDNDRYDPADND